MECWKVSTGGRVSLQSPSSRLPCSGKRHVAENPLYRRVFEQHAESLPALWLLLCSCPWPLTSLWRGATVKKEKFLTGIKYSGFFLFFIGSESELQLWLWKDTSSGLVSGPAWWVSGHHCACTIPDCGQSCSRVTVDVMRDLMKINALLSWGPKLAEVGDALDLVVMAGSEKKKKKKKKGNGGGGKSQPGCRDFSSKLCCLSRVCCCLLGACVLAVLSAAVDCCLWRRWRQTLNVGC